MSSKNKYLKIIIVFFIAILFAQVTFGQFTIPEIPKFQTSVYDYANCYHASTKKQL